MKTNDDENPPEFSSLTFSGYTDAYIMYMKFSSYQSKKEGKQIVKAFNELYLSFKI